MLANAAGIMPDQLKFEADQQFFERGLDRVDVVVHGRHSHEQQPHSHLRRRLILTRRVPAIAADPSHEKALFWNPAARRSSKPWPRWGCRTPALASSAERTRSRCSWTVMTFSICRGRPACGCPGAAGFSRGARTNAGGRPRKPWARARPAAAARSRKRLGGCELAAFAKARDDKTPSAAGPKRVNPPHKKAPPFPAGFFIGEGESEDSIN